VLLTAGDGTIYLVKVGDEKAKVVAKNKGFNHISSSADGQFFVVDDFRNGVLYVGSLVTGRCLPLCDSHASCGRPQYTHTHPYITPNNRYVIFNSDQTGICQIYAAEIPDGFLDDLTAS
jgi:Tol biopolymer transport system component